MNNPPSREVALFSAALELEASQRTAYLDQACADDPALRQRLEALLAVHEKALTFLETSARGEQTSSLESEPAGGLAGLPGPLTEKAGDRIGRYKLLQQIGEGGCGVVYMAEQEEPVRRRVALKVIKLGMDTKRVVARFEAERQALALMDHPHIAKVLDAGATDAGRPYFVMELVRGIKITDYCDENQLSTEARLKLFIQVCQAVQHAHQKGIIHRDLKPSNILVADHDGVPLPKVIDFGVAKATTDQRLTDKTLFTAFEQFIGTPAYMSPEQAKLSGLDIDTRTDIYSLGVLLYELLTGKTPLDQKELLASGLDEMRRTIREREPVRPSTRLSAMLEGELTTTAKHRQTDAPKLVHLLRGDLDWIVMKALEKERARRYETANGLAMDVQRHLADEPVVARPPSRLYEFQKAVRRHKFGFAATAAVLLVLAGGVAVSSWEAIQARHAEREQARLYLVAQTKEKKSEQTAQFLQDMLRGVGPSVALGRDTSLLKEILDKTVERVGKDLTNQPELEVELCLTLAYIYRDLALPDQMERLARRCLEVARAKLGLENESVAKSLISLGDAEMLLGQRRAGVIHFGRVSDSERQRHEQDSLLAESERLCSEALAMNRKLLGNETPAVASGLYDLGLVLELRCRMAESESKFREALAMYQKLFGKEDLRTAMVLYELAGVLAHEHKSLAEAEDMTRQALAIQRRKLGTGDHPSTGRSRYMLALLLSFREKWSESEIEFREVLASWKRLRMDEQPVFAEAQHNLGYNLMQQDKLDEAETLFRQALALRRKLVGNEHADAAESLHKLVLVVFQQGRTAEAGTLCREELELQRKLEPGGGGGLASAMSNLGYLMMQRDKLAEAETLLRDAVAMQPPGDADPQQWLAWNNLAIVFEREGKLVEAEATYHDKLAVQRKLVGNEDGTVVDSLTLLADLLQRQGRTAEARPHLEEAAGILVRHPEKDEFLLLYQPLKHVLRALGDISSVENLNARLLKKLRQKAEDGNVAALNGLAWLLATCPEAEFRDGTNAVTSAEAAVAATERKNIECLDTLAAAYAETGQFTKAISIQKEALALPHTGGGEAVLTSRLKLYESNAPYREAD
jgi:tetratricopeptide (TPR) repeat protein